MATERKDGVHATLSLIHPVGLAIAPDGSLYVGDPPYIRRITPDGIISTVAGSGQDPSASLLHHFDAAGRHLKTLNADRIVPELSAGALSLRRDAQNGLLTGTMLGELVDSWTYNAFAEPLHYGATASGSAIFSLGQTRSVDGRIAATTNTIVGVSTTRDYTYDEAGRLARVSSGGTPIVEYDYDAHGTGSPTARREWL